MHISHLYKKRQMKNNCRTLGASLVPRSKTPKLPNHTNDNYCHFSPFFLRLSPKKVQKSTPPPSYLLRMHFPRRFPALSLRIYLQNFKNIYFNKETLTYRDAAAAERAGLLKITLGRHYVLCSQVRVRLIFSGVETIQNARGPAPKFYAVSSRTQAISESVCV